MNMNQKRKIFQKLLAWGFLELNFIISTVVTFILTFNYNILIWGIAVVIAIFLYAWTKLSRDITVNDLSNASIWGVYVGVWIVSLVFVYRIFTMASTVGALALLFVIILEVSTFAIMLIRQKYR